ncbi:hypothetical protein SDC9_53972 [bioreactor metagenome]|uniref:SLH domain-containing protein n=1 Tax=bioreactor metagenome TaxID=1076179 RepID=A0A644WUS3_9ZZZZ
MRKKALSWLLFVSMMLSLFISAPITAHAAEATQRYICDAEALNDGTIGVLFICGGTSSSGIVSGGNLYYGIYDPTDNGWIQQPVGIAVGAKDAAMALDSLGVPHVVYVTAVDTLAYTYLNGSEWTAEVVIESIAFGGTAGALSWPDIAIDSSGYAHISYMDAKGGYTGGNNYSSYEKEDLVYAQNTSGSFTKTVRSYSHGWFYSPDGWRNLVHAPTKIALSNDQSCIGVKQYQYDKDMSTQYHTYGYDLLFDSTSLNYPIRSATTNNDLGFKLFEMDSDGSTVYSLFNKSSTLYVTGGVTEIAAATKAFTATTADMTVSGSDVYYAAINGAALLFYQNGIFLEGLTATTALSSTHSRMATVVTGGNQYILYTGNDTDKSLFIASVPTSGGDLTEYKVPNKTPVSITGVNVDNKQYDGNPITPGGTLTVTGAPLTESDLVYAYNGISGTVYPLSTIPPTNAGTYELIISVSEDNETYTGTSAPINFTITKKDVTVTGTTAVNRVYAPGAGTVLLNSDASALSGVIAADEPLVTLDKSFASGTVATDGAGNGKSVTVTGFALTGSKAANYALSQPTGITVDIAPAERSAPTVNLSADSDNGGLSITVSDDANSLGVSSYTVEIYEGNDLKKILTEINKESAQNVPLEPGIIEPGSTYTAKAKAVADTSGNYTDSALGELSMAAIAQYAPLSFVDSAAYDVPASQVDKPIAEIHVSGGVTGGRAPYVYSATDLPAWLSIGATTGIITGTPTAVAAAGGTATVTVTDAQSNHQSITIAYNAVGKGDALNFGGTAPPSTKTYGDTPFDIAGLTYDGGDGTVSYSYVAGPGSLSGTTLTITGAGDIVVRATGTSANYEDKTENHTITVNPKPITITPTGTPTKTYGEVDPELTYSSTPLVDGSPLSGSILTRTTGENAGDYAISLHPDAAVANPNYDLTLTSGSHKLTITKKALTISGAAINAKVYDGTTAIDLDKVTSVTFDGLVNGDTLGPTIDFQVTAAAYSDDAFAGTGKATSITVALKNTAKANNYEFMDGAEAYAGTTADITAATQTITAVNQTLTVTHMLDLSTIASSNAGTDATLTYAIDDGASDYATLTGSVLTGTAPGTLTININSTSVNVNGAGDTEYSDAAQKQITVTISDKTNADADISFEDDSITYGQTYVPSPTTTLTGGAWSYQYAGTANDGTIYDSTAAPTKAGSYAVAAAFENDTHIGAKTVTLTIAPKNISIAGVTATSREYDGTTDVDITGGTLNGIVGTDTVTPTVPAMGTVGDANVGNHKAVTLGTITLAGGDKDNYTLTQPTGITVNITPKVITFTVEAVADQAYTGFQLTPEPTVKDGGVTLTKDTHYTLSYGTNLTAGAGAGSITVTGIGNYLGSNAEAAFDIIKATYGGPPIQATKQVISNTASEDIAYDLSALNFSTGFSNKSFISVTVANDSEGLLSGASLSGSILTFDVVSKAAGITGELHVVVGSTNYNDYTVVLAVTTVDKTPVTVTGVTVANKTYNATPVAPGGAPVNSGGYSGMYEYRYNGAGSTVYNSATAPTNAGDYRLTVRIPAADPTYTGEQTVDFSILKAALTVKPQNMSIYIGDSLPTPTAAYDGLQGSDAGATVAQLSSGNLDMEIKDSDGVTALTNSATAGNYAIVFTGLPVFSAADNYTIATAAGVLAITNRPSSGGSGGSTSPAAPKQEAHIGGGTGTATAEVKTDTKTGSASVELSSAQIFGGRDIVVTMPKIDDVTTNILDIPVPSLSGASGKGSITLNTVAGNITLPSDMLTGIDSATGSKAQVSIGMVKTSDLPSAAQEQVGNRPIVSLHLSIDGKTTAWNNPDAPVTVSIPYTPTAVELQNPDRITAYYIDSSGNLVELKDAKYDPVTKAVIFTTTHFSYYAVGYKTPVTNTQFSDVLPGAWYYAAVTFIAEKGITAGTGDGKFSPEAALTRGQFIVMLMRAYGIEPDANRSDNFDDAGSTYYTSYLAAAKRLGISNGVGNNNFAPEQAITRQELFTLLYNALKALGTLPDGDTGRTLADFSDGGDVADWAREAMNALVNAGTVAGSNSRLVAAGGSTRGQMAQVLYNLLSK